MSTICDGSGQSVYKTYIILYHNYAASSTVMPIVEGQVKNVGADIIVITDRGVNPLVDAVRARFGLKTSNATAQRRPLGP